MSSIRERERERRVNIEGKQNLHKFIWSRSKFIFVPMDIDFTDNRGIKINLRAEPVAPPLSNQDLKTCQLSLPARWKINEREKCEHRRRDKCEYGRKAEST